jgi:NtrC-family two-component system response regulator AlgB
VILAPNPVIEPEDLGITPDRAIATPGVGASVTLAELEREHIGRILNATSSYREASATLGIDETTLWRKRKQYGL